MNISKTLFKNLIRCDNFSALYDMYINRSFSTIKSIDNNEFKNIKTIIDETPLDFNDLSDDAIDIFNCMFDDISGEDLLNQSNAQLEAFKDIYNNVEELAIAFASRIFNHEIIASKETKKQKRFEYHDNGHTFYCYLDGYLEKNNHIYIFEVKATSSKNLKEQFITCKSTKEKYPLFKKNNSLINELIDYKQLTDLNLNIDDIYKKISKLLEPFDKIGKYIYDIAIERHIIENSMIENHLDYLIPNIHYYLITLNDEYCFDGKYVNDIPLYNKDENNNELFEIYDMNELTKLLQDEIITKRNNLEHNLNSLTYASNRTSNNCQYKKTLQCKFFPVCFNNVLKDDSILELLNRNSALKDHNKKSLSIYDFINKKIFFIKDLKDFLFSRTSLQQYDCIVNNHIYINKEKINEMINLINYPLYHLDFETYNSPLPRFKGEHPYEQSVFQYSLHIEKEPGVCDFINDHFEYLAPDHKDHRKDLIKQLISQIDLSKGGTVIAYNASFEKQRLQKFAIDFPEYKSELNLIISHIFDLLDVLKTPKKLYKQLHEDYSDIDYDNDIHFNYYHKGLHGSYSIKKVLPLFTSLTYKDLDVKNGTEAILTYGLLPTLTEQEYKDKYLALRIYCRQDTWAMVEILKGLRQISK